MRILTVLETLFVAQAGVCSCTFGLRKPWYSLTCTSSCI